MTLLMSKLALPAPDGCLDRERLIRPLLSLSQVRLVQVIAGAGFGKTTLVAQALASGDRVPVWYRLDRFDRDFSLFTTYLTRALEQAFPGHCFDFPDPPPPSLTEGDRWVWLIPWLAALDDGLPARTVLALDDYHLVDQDINSTLEFILERLPSRLSIIVISRRETGLKVSRMRAGRQVLDVQEGDLAFTPDETRAFFCRIPGQDSGPVARDIDDIHHKTGGWAAGLVLFSSAVKQDVYRKISRELVAVSGSRRHVFAYLEENIFNLQPVRRKKFMTKTALLEFMDTGFCDRVLGIEDSKEMFRKMMADHLMVFPVDGEETAFYYHHLLRDFLREKAAKHLGRGGIRRVHLAAAGILAPEQHPMALHHYIEAGDYKGAADMLSALEVEFLLRGEMPFVKECLDKIPARIRESDPQLLFMEAKQHSYYGRPDLAIERLTRARRIFMDRGEPDQGVKCLVDLAAQYYYTGCIPEAKRLMEQVLEEIDTDSPTYILVMTYLIFFSAVLGDAALSESYENRARDVISLYPEFEHRAALILINTSVSHRHYIKGAFNSAQEVNRWLLAEIQETGLAACLPLACYQSAATDYYLGNYEAGLAHAGNGIRAAGKIHLRDSQKGWIYLAWAENTMGLGRWAEAAGLVRQGYEIFKGPDNRWGRAYALNLMARICLKEKKFSEAHGYLDRAVEIIHDRGLDNFRANIDLTRARLLVCGRDHEGALALLSGLETSLAPSPHFQGLARLLAVKCRIALGLDPPGADRALIGRIRAQAGPEGWEAWLLARLAESGNDRESAGVKASESPGITRDRHPGLTVNLMGPFRLSLGDREIRYEDWTHAKSLTLFQYLAAHQDKGYLSKDLLLEVLWPDQDAGRTGKRFNVAMSRLRRLLEPDLASRAGSAYILRRRDQYRLSLGPGGTCDLTEFQTRARGALGKDIENPETAKALCTAAVECYGGPFLSEILYEDWCTRIRQDMSALYCRVLDRLIRICLDQNDLEAVRKWILAYLAEDPYDETRYQQLMTVYAGLGRSERVARCFDRCRRQMEKIDCPLSARTKDLFRELMAGKTA